MVWTTCTSTSSSPTQGWAKQSKSCHLRDLENKNFAARLRAPSYFVNTETPEVKNLIENVIRLNAVPCSDWVTVSVINCQHGNHRYHDDDQGLMLHYRSKRRGFTTYTAGQLKAVAQTYFKTEMGIEVRDRDDDEAHTQKQIFRWKSPRSNLTQSMYPSRFYCIDRSKWKTEWWKKVKIMVSGRRKYTLQSSSDTTQCQDEFRNLIFRDSYDF